MHQHFRVLGWVLIVVGIVGIIFIPMLGKAAMRIREMLPTLLSSSHGATPVPDDPTWIVSVTPLLLLVAAVEIAAVAAVCIAAGYGLLKRRQWARALTIVASVILLPGTPIATLIGVYGLWLMLSYRGRQAWAGYIG